MAQTTNYNLYKYELGNPADLTKINGNMDIIDAELKEHQDGIDNHEERIDTAEASITDHETRIDTLEEELANIVSPIVTGNITLNFTAGQNLPVNINVGFKPKMFHLVYNSTGGVAVRTTYIQNEPIETMSSGMLFTDTGISFNMGNPNNTGNFTMKITYACYR